MCCLGDTGQGWFLSVIPVRNLSAGNGHIYISRYPSGICQQISIRYLSADIHQVSVSRYPSGICQQISIRYLSADIHQVSVSRYPSGICQRNAVSLGCGYTTEWLSTDQQRNKPTCKQANKSVKKHFTQAKHAQEKYQSGDYFSTSI